MYLKEKHHDGHIMVMKKYCNAYVPSSRIVYVGVGAYVHGAEESRDAVALLVYLQ